MMACSCGASFAKIILIVINIIFFLTGVALLGVGIWLITDPNVSKLINTVVSTESHLFQAAAILLIALGVLVLLVSILGFVGACLEHRTVLAIYIALVAIVFAGEVAGGIITIVYKDKIIKQVDNSLRKSLLTATTWLNPYYVNTTEHKCKASDEGALWDYVQVKFNCCGVHDEPNSGYEGSTIRQFCPSLNLAIARPVTCCRQINDTGGVLNLKTNDQLQLKKNFDCTRYKTWGCSDEVVNWIEKNAPVLIGVGIGIGMFELLVIVFALCLCQHITYKND